MQTATVQGRQLEYVVRLPSAHPKPNAPAMVFLHEGLGSVAMWRDFPQRVADATGCEAIVYSRYGYGRSARLEQAHSTRYMHDEGLAALPEFLDKLSIEKPILFGHSDGGSIALIYAGGTSRPLSAIITERIARICRKKVDLLKLANCRYSSHKDQPDAVIAAVADFTARILN